MVGFRFTARGRRRSRGGGVNCFDLIDVTIIFRAPIATPTVVDGNLFFCQGGDQLNRGRKETGDFQPVINQRSVFTIVVQMYLLERRVFFCHICSVCLLLCFQKHNVDISMS